MSCADALAPNSESDPAKATVLSLRPLVISAFLPFAAPVLECSLNLEPALWRQPGASCPLSGNRAIGPRRQRSPDLARLDSRCRRSHGADNRRQAGAGGGR